MNEGIRFDLTYETMPCPKVDAVFFDIGNVLIRYAPDDFVQQLFPGDEAAQQHMLEHVFGGPYWPEFDRGTMDYEEAARRLSAQFGRTEAEYLHALRGWIELKKFADRFALIDGGCISSDCHQLKPEPEIYRTLIDQCGLTPERTLFIDDTLANVEGAMKSGIHGFHMHENGMMDRFFI